MPFRKKTGTASDGSLWRTGGGTGQKPLPRKTAEYPGYKNQKQADRGGTRRQVIIDNAKEAAIRKAAREARDEERRQALVDKAEALKEKAQKKKEAADRARQKREDDKVKQEREKERKITAKTLKAQRDQQRAAAKKQREEVRAAKTEARRSKKAGKASLKNRNN